jgi:ribulose-phosphate 3-epimerase
VGTIGLVVVCISSTSAWRRARNPDGSGADWLHIGVMDGHFAPTLTVGLPVVCALNSAADIPLDCHLMIEDPDRSALAYAQAGAADVTVHLEAVRNPVVLAADLRVSGSRAGLAIQPPPRCHHT